MLEVPIVGALPKKAPKVMNWTPPMSTMMLKGISEVAERGAKTDKGFKEATKLKLQSLYLLSLVMMCLLLKCTIIFASGGIGGQGLFI